MTAIPIPSSSAHRADLSDAGLLARLRWIWRTVEGDEDGDWDRFRADFADWMAGHEHTHVPFIVERAESAIGMAWLAIVERVPGPQRWTRLSGAIQSVYVLAEKRNKGVGTVLVRELIEGARGVGLDYLSVHPSPLSFPFYRRLGFTGEGPLLYLDLGSQ